MEIAELALKCTLGVICCKLAIYCIQLLWQGRSCRKHEAISCTSPSSPSKQLPQGLFPSVKASTSFRSTIQPWSDFDVQTQLASLNQFRQQLVAKNHHVPDDLTCLRFLRARRLQLEKALAFYESHWEWYTSEVAGRIFAEPLDKKVEDILKKSYPSTLIGRDPKGRPVKLVDVGQVDMARLKKQNINEAHVIDFHIMEMEKLARSLALRDDTTTKDLNARPGPDVDESLWATDPMLGHVCIFDTYNCSVSKFMSAITLWMMMAKVDQNGYPELLGAAFFIRCPRLFSWAWKTLKPYLDPRTVAKMHVVEGDPYDRIAELVGAENVPPALWGHRKPPFGASGNALRSRSASQVSGMSTSEVGCMDCWGNCGKRKKSL